MSEIDTNFIPKSREYLKKFVVSHHLGFKKDSQEFQPRNGYGNFLNSSLIVQCMREISIIVRDEFGDLSIPERFTSPEDLINKSKRFVDQLEFFESYFTESMEDSQKNKGMIPTPVEVINENRLKTIETFKMFIKLAEKENSENDTIHNYQTPIEILEKIFNKFHLVVNQLLERRKENDIPRETIKIKDEYDVQDLLHALLKIDFEDVRPEEWNPSYAGSSTRSDFLLKSEKIIIEVKKARKGLKDKEIGGQLIIDIAHYKKHADCETLLCFVYDPDNLIQNPRGIENDLKEITQGFKTMTLIRP